MCGAGSMKRCGVRSSLRSSMGPLQQTRCCRFAAVGPAGRRCRSIAAAASCCGWMRAGSATLSAYAEQRLACLLTYLLRRCTLQLDALVCGMWRVRVTSPAYSTVHALPSSSSIPAATIDVAFSSDASVPSAPTTVPETTSASTMVLLQASITLLTD